MGKQKVHHLGVIMDGNRRWAKQHMFKSVMKGHEAGVETFIDLCEWCEDEDIDYLTVYAFSTENFNRAAAEVSDLFKLMRRFFTEEIYRCIDNGVQLHVIGNLDLLSPEDREVVSRAEEVTKDCDKLYLQIAIGYGGRDEIIRGIKRYAKAVEDGTVGGWDDLTEESFASYLDTKDVPDVDLVIRTGGNQRLSNFLPWQTTYAEIFFTPVLWPDFSKEEMKKALDYYETVNVNKGK